MKVEHTNKNSYQETLVIQYDATNFVSNHPISRKSTIIHPTIGNHTHCTMIVELSGWLFESYHLSSKYITIESNMLIYLYTTKPRSIENGIRNSDLHIQFDFASNYLLSLVETNKTHL